jgi:uncharacterized protein YjlB
MNVESHLLQPDGGFPNNPKLPLLVYRQTIPVDDQPAEEFERRFAENGWAGTWRNGVYLFHHYHSNAHEVLGVAAGTARIQFGGPHGPVVTVNAGDMVVLPAGTAHMRIEASADFLVVGAYPAGQEDYDLLRGEPEAVKPATNRIAAVPQPQSDPIAGPDGPLMQAWTAR